MQEHQPGERASQPPSWKKRLLVGLAVSVALIFFSVGSCFVVLLTKKNNDAFPQSFHDDDPPKPAPADFTPADGPTPPRP